MIKVSIIIPIYNMELYLEECLNSIINQTLKEIEIICINDGSTDNCLDILYKYALNNNSIIIVDQENVGVGKSRNNGLDIAQGEFVAFMDPDDYYPDNYILECLYNNAKEHNVNICGGSFSGFKDGSMITEYSGWAKNYTFQKDGKISYSDYQFHYGFTRFIYNLRFLKENNIYFPKYIRYEDPPFFVRAMICTEEFYAIKKITYCYREGHKKLVLSHKKTIDYAKGVIDLLHIAKKNKFIMLHNNIVQTMFYNLYPAMYKFISEGNAEFKELAYNINSFINFELLQEESSELKNYFLSDPNLVLSYIIERKKNFITTILKYREVIIYGAGHVGKITLEYLNSIDNIKIICFAVSDASKNESEINGISVRNINDITKYKETALILVATGIKFHKEIEKILNRLEYKNVMPIYSYEFEFYKNIIV